MRNYKVFKSAITSTGRRPRTTYLLLVEAAIFDTSIGTLVQNRSHFREVATYLLTRSSSLFRSTIKSRTTSVPNLSRAIHSTSPSSRALLSTLTPRAISPSAMKSLDLASFISRLSRMQTIAYDPFGHSIGVKLRLSSGGGSWNEGMF